MRRTQASTPKWHVVSLGHFDYLYPPTSRPAANTHRAPQAEMLQVLRHGERIGFITKLHVGRGDLTSDRNCTSEKDRAWRTFSNDSGLCVLPHSNPGEHKYLSILSWRGRELETFIFRLPTMAFNVPEKTPNVVERPLGGSSPPSPSSEAPIDDADKTLEALGYTPVRVCVLCPRYIPLITPRSSSASSQHGPASVLP